jgi:exopolyphosphatase
MILFVGRAIATFMLFLLARTTLTSALSPTLLASSIVRQRSHIARQMASTTSCQAAKGMVEFLNEQKNRLVQDPNQPFHLVIGNPAGDADSIVSALGLAYVDSLWNNKDYVLPVVSVSKHDLTTQRPETTYLLELAGIPVDSLVCIDDPNLPMTADVTLVDHNHLQVQREDWHVVEILDHHLDEGVHQDSVLADKRTIAFSGTQATVASCTTLIAERYLAHMSMSSSSSSSASSPIPTSLATLLLGVILLDSVNMSTQAGKGTTRDAAVIQSLLQDTDWSVLADNPMSADIITMSQDSSTTTPDTKKFFEALQYQKFNPKFWDKLSVQDALGLDYKEFTTGGEDVNISKFGVATVLQSMQDFCQKENLLESIQEYIKAHDDIGLLGIMFAVSNDQDELSRQLAICGPPELCKSMVEFLQHVDRGLDLSEARSEDLLFKNASTNSSVIKIKVVFMDQGNVAASRKQVAPTMMNYWKQE